MDCDPHDVFILMDRFIKLSATRKSWLRNLMRKIAVRRHKAKSDEKKSTNK